MNTSIKEIGRSDCELLASWFNNPENNKWLTSIYRLGKYNQIVHELSLKKRDNLFYTIYVGQNPVGFVGLSFIDLLDKTAMLWYVLGDKSYANKGITTTAVNLILEKAFNNLKLHSVYAVVAEENKSSLRVLEKTKFKRSGIQRESHFSDNRYQNKIYLDILYSEYRSI